MTYDLGKSLEQELERRLERNFSVYTITTTRDELTGEYILYFILDNKICGYRYSSIINDIPPLVALYKEVERLKNIKSLI